MFEQAAKTKLRFNFNASVVSTEDLYDLSLYELNTMAKFVNKNVKENEEESFIAPVTLNEGKDTLRLNILKAVIKFKLDVMEANKTATQKKAKKDKIMEILFEKENDDLKSMSKEELTELLND